MHILKDIIKRNVFTTELTYTFNMLIPEDKIKKAMNLIVAQDCLKKDLYYSISVFSNISFTLWEAESYEHEYEIIIDQEKGGGTPNEETFYTNPQIYFKAENQSSKKFNWWLSYKVDFYETSVKIFLVREDEPERVESITEENQVGNDESPYYNKSCASHFILNWNCSYK